MIDAHHHIWRQSDLPWLSGPEQPRIFGSYGAIRRDYLIDEYLSDIAGTGITRSVYVQANWPPDRAHAETAWVNSVAEASGWPHAIVGYLDTGADAFAEMARRMAALPRVRGIRHQFHWHDQPLYRFASGPADFLTPTVVRNISTLGTLDLHFELQVFAPQMMDAARLVDACPGTTFVLQHAGMLEDTTDTGWAAWRAGMHALAARPNVVTKLSAFGTFLHRNDPAHIRRMIDETLAIFPSERAMYGSNFPIEKIWTSHDALWSAFHDAVAHRSGAEKANIFNDTAQRVYRL